MIIPMHIPQCAALLAAGAFSWASNAQASDWQYAGYSEIGSRKVHQFFDAETLRRPTNTVVRVWVRAIETKDFISYYESHDQAINEKVAPKIAKYYAPQYLSIPKIRQRYDGNDFLSIAVELTINEVIANIAGGVPTALSVLFEIDCQEQRSRVLEATDYSKSARGNGHQTTTSASGFSFIEPDTNVQWLATMVCPKGR